MINILIWESSIIFIVVLIIKLRLDFVLKCNKIVLNMIIAAMCIIPIGIDFMFGAFPITYYESNIIDLSTSEETWENVGEIIDGTTVEQTFVCETPYIYKISLFTQTYGKKQDGTVEVELVNKETEEIVQKWEETLENIPNDDFWELTIDDAANKKMESHEYSIVIRTYGMDDYNFITIVTCGDSYNDGAVYIDDEQEDEDLLFKVASFTLKKNMECVRAILCILAFATIVYIEDLLLHEKNN